MQFLPWRAGAVLLIATCLGIGSFPAQAEPDSDSNPAWSDWFRSLKTPREGTSCCSLADCRRTVSRIRDGHYEALLGKRWVVVPPEKVLDHAENPTGEAVLCWSPVSGVLCFVRGPEG